jgi:hypothetical protein
MSEPGKLSRRNFVGGSLAGAALSGAAGKALAAPPGDAGSQQGQPAAEKTAMPYGTIGGVRFSRLMLGGNLVGGFMHARDLKYVNRLFRAYVTEEKILDTFKLAEEHGVNTVLETGAAQVRQYNQRYGGHMQIIPSIHPSLTNSDQDVKDEIREKIDAGCAALYVWGAAGDQLVRAGAIDRIAKAVELVKDQGLPAGVGGHSLEVPIACEKQGVPCDFYVKTLHDDNYPSATPKELRKEYIWLGGGEGWYDNMWCINPEETIAFMKSVAKPWIAFKILAAGAIHPRQAFAHAFDNGADFIGVGMFDFQVEENCELVPRLVERARTRPRPWWG